MPVTISSKKGDTVVEIDEAPRRDTTLETLAKLPAIFVKDGSHTAGNAPGVNDGAGALVVASEDWAKANGKTPLAKIVAQASVADDFAYLARTPANATKAALEKAGPDGRRHRPVRDQRGLRLCRAQLGAHARGRREQGQRERRRHRARAIRSAPAAPGSWAR